MFTMFRPKIKTVDCPNYNRIKSLLQENLITASMFTQSTLRKFNCYNAEPGATAPHTQCLRPKNARLDTKFAGKFMLVRAFLHEATTIHSNTRVKNQVRVSNLLPKSVLLVKPAFLPY